MLVIVFLEYLYLGIKISFFGFIKCEVCEPQIGHVSFTTSDTIRDKCIQNFHLGRYRGI